jgi:hypothetical protein
MRADKGIVDRLSTADPARAMSVPPAATAATELIARAETGAGRENLLVDLPPRRPAHGRRLGLAVAAAMVPVAIAGMVYVLSPGAADNPSAAGATTPVVAGRVLVPIAYAITTDAPAAAAHLRALAKRVTDAPYDTKAGRYAYRHTKSWGTTVQSAEGFEMGFVEEWEEWTAPDGSGRTRTKRLGAEFPNEESRRYFEQRIAEGDYGPIPNESVEDVPAPSTGVAETPGPITQNPYEPPRPADRTRPPSNVADLAKLLRVEHGALDAAKWTMELYRSYAVPRQTRAQVLEILASLGQFVWRGQVTDRAGRTGVAISVDHTVPDKDMPDDPHDSYQMVLIFNPDTGELLASEFLALAPARETLSYISFIGHDRVDALG